MFCPQCESEFRPGFDHCPDCDVDLVAELPPEPGHDTDVYETVLETSDPDLVPLFKSLLDSAEIPYETWGEDLLNLFPLPAGSLTLPPRKGEVVFLVPGDRAEEARQLLDSEHPQLSEGSLPVPAASDAEPTDRNDSGSNV